MTIDRGSDRPVYRQLADLIRDEITSGRVVPGSLLQAEGALAQQHDVGRDTVRRALSVLRNEGLIVADHTGHHVRAHAELTVITVPAGTEVAARMPTDPECREYGIGEGVPVLVVGDRLYPADRYRVMTER